MEFSNLHVQSLITHQSPILHIGHFDNNDDDHFFSLSDNSELKEWILPSSPNTNATELESNFLHRPCQNFLSSLGHVQTKKNHSNPLLNEMRITSSLFYENLMIFGYEDGLVLVWRQERRDVVPKRMLVRNNSFKNSNKRTQRFIRYQDKDRIKAVLEELENRTAKARVFDDVTLFTHKDDSEFVKCVYTPNFVKVLEEKVAGENDKKFNYKSYYNIMWLKYIFVGQTQEISNLLLSYPQSSHFSLLVFL